MYVDNIQKLINYQGHRSKVKVTWFFGCIFCPHDTHGQHLALSEGFILFAYNILRLI